MILTARSERCREMCQKQPAGRENEKVEVCVHVVDGRAVAEVDRSLRQVLVSNAGEGARMEVVKQAMMMNAGHRRRGCPDGQSTAACENTLNVKPSVCKDEGA